jgi:hypothetical protein
MAHAWANVAPRKSGEPIWVTVTYGDGKEARIIIGPDPHIERGMPLLPAIRLELAEILLALESGLQSGNDPVWQNG